MRVAKWKISLRGLVLAILSFLLLQLCYAQAHINSRKIFRSLCSAITARAPQLYLQEFVKKYKNYQFSGKVYFMTVTIDDSGNQIVNLATEADLSSPGCVGVILYTRTNMPLDKKKYQRGNQVNFYGRFKEIRMKSIVVDNGIIVKK